MAELLPDDSVAQVRPPRERRHVFTDYSPPAQTRSNRPFRKKKISTLSIIFALFLLAISLVTYIGNIIAVNSLAVQLEELKTTYSSIENMNNILRSEINRKMSMERITKIASEQMGMTFPQQPPIWIEVEVSPAGEGE